jgi:precorrin-4/cobalt-precorrin-4 C11-methyltransferase
MKADPEYSRRRNIRQKLRFYAALNQAYVREQQKSLTVGRTCSNQCCRSFLCTGAPGGKKSEELTGRAVRRSGERNSRFQRGGLQRRQKMVSFIGAGPGDPELLTIRGKKIIDRADVIIYAGSLVNPQVLADVKEGAVIYNSATMNLDEVIQVMKDAEAAGLKVARVHTGDPAIYGAHREQMDRLDELGIEYEIVPGVSSFLATAAVLKKEYTLPGVSQTVILTRMEGRTPMPPKEKLLDLAQHNATMIIFLSVGMLEEMSQILRQAYRPETPAAVVYKATWEDQKIVYGDLTNIAERVRAAGIKKTALTVVGDFLGNEYELSKLYDKTFTTEFRKGVAE